MMRCSPEAFAKCPTSHLCGSLAGATFAEGSECDTFNNKIYEIQTNADRIRAMSDEELATFWSDHYDNFCPNKPECGQYINEGKDIHAEWCAACALKWLRQPAEEVTNGRSDC